MHRVSATSDLEAERAAAILPGVIGRTLAELPIQIGAEIRRCPPEGVSYETLFDLISNVDRVYFLLGQDHVCQQAVSGTWPCSCSVLWWRAARRAGSHRRHSCTIAQHLLAGNAFQVEGTPSEWKFFRTETELAGVVGQDLIDTPRKAARFGLTLEETLRLQLHRKRVSVLTVHAAARQRR